ncbi:Hsp70 family protein [Sphingomonas arantia]|uniref:Hsp70 family protein n=1 Tax=Sphingomonas arantia TaxID=1460676 RepID=A0ABW4TUM7_9SPHN
MKDGMIVGIDLGTTNSLVGYWRDGAAQLVPNALGSVLTPSCVSLDDDGSILVGAAALDRLRTHPNRTAAVFKRTMGSTRHTRLGKRDFLPEELSSFVLRALKDDAVAHLGVPVTGAIITVPAYFSDPQRKATRRAAQLAGLGTVRLLNEPTAAAMAYGLQSEAEGTFLIFDLGGGTFDVSVLELFDGVMEVRASAGDNFLGGEDFRQILTDAFLRDAKVPEKALANPAIARRIDANVERAKRALSSEPTAEIALDWDDTHYAASFTTEQFETLSEPLLERLRRPIRIALGDARIAREALDAVVLAGGATRMPMVRREATKLFGRFPVVDIDPDEVIARGAAVQAGLLMRDAALSDRVMTDVAPYSLGTDIRRRLDDGQFVEGWFDPIIPRNTIVPASREKSYIPTSPTSKAMIIDVYQGEARMVRDNIALGRLTVPLPSGNEAERAVDVRFTYDVDGLLEIEARRTGSSEVHRLVLQELESDMSEAEIATRLKALSAIKLHPRETIENRTLLARGERMVEEAQGDAREAIAMAVSQFEAVLERQDPAQVGAARDQLRGQLDWYEGRVFADD